MKKQKLSELYRRDHEALHFPMPRESELDSAERGILQEHLKDAEPGEAEGACPPAALHYYWGIMNGGWQVLSRVADQKHPINNLWDVRNNPPAGVEPMGADRFDPFG
jgi:hypothetical protein